MTSATATMKPQKFSIHDILTRSPPTVQTYTTDVTITDQTQAINITVEIVHDGMDNEYGQIFLASDESSALNITTLPTPPQSPETDDNAKKANNADETNIIQAEHNDTRSLKRKRDPIGQILDSLCSKAEKKSSTEPSAFSPIITSSSSPQLSPLSMLSQCERRSVQTSPHGLSVHPQPHPPTQQLSVHTHPQTQNVATKCTNKDQLHVEHLRIIEAQKMAHIQQMYHHQQQQQHARLHQHRHQLQSQVPGLHSRQLPYFVPTSAPHNIQQLQLMQERHAHLMALETQNANMMINTSHVGNMVSPPRLTGPQPAWLSWLKTTNAAMDQMTSLPLKETRIPPPPRYQCDACKKSYSSFGGLSKHKQFHCVSHVKKEFNCKYCEKSYGSLGALKMHIRTHTLPCKCKLCGKAFSRPWLLQGHLRTHTGEKPFSCAHCGRAFADRSNLRAHLQTHSDIKKYACKNCTKTFSRMSLLLKHEEGSCIGLRR